MAPPATSYDPAAESTHSGPRRSPWVIVLLVVAVLVLGGIIGYSLFQGLRDSDSDSRSAAAVTQSNHSSPVRASDPPVQ
jgi:hypothetical protein